MEGRYKQKMNVKPFLKLLTIPVIASLSFLAVLTGIQAGNLLYKLDANIVEKIDPENFKQTLNLSFPMMDTIYNSGKKSTSFSGEVKGLFAKIFEIDLDSPMTILNVQSPLFKSYFDNEYKSLLATDNDGQKPQDQSTPGTDATKASDSGEGGVTGETGGGTGKDGSAAGGSNKDGTSSDGTGGSAVAAQVPGQQENNRSEGEPEHNPGNDGGTPAASGNTGKTPSDSGKSVGDAATALQPDNLQPVSSITYEGGDEEESGKSDVVALDKVVVQNFTNHKIDIAKLLKEPLNLKLSRKGPKVLIYHTHTTESYVLKAEDLGKKNVASYNSNPKYSVVRVGEELAKYLKKYGIETLHNATVHDQNRNASYGESIKTLQSYVKSYPSIKVYIDIHRDGLDSTKPKLRLVKQIKGRNAAQIMFVMGTNDLLPHPDWEENLKFALKVEQKLNEKYPGLARPVWLVKKRYNQQVSDQAVLIEVGGDGNLLSECVESMKYLAEALNDVLKEYQR